MYNKSTQDLFDYVNKTMSKEDLSDLQLQQGEVLKKYNALNAPAIIEEDGSVVKQAGPLHVSQEEKDKITSELDAEDLFTPITKKVNISKDPKYSQIIDRTEQPYEEELNKAKQDLISSGVESPTKEQIEDRVRYTIKEQRIQDVYDQKATDYMNSDEVEETDLDALLKLGGFLNKKINFETKKRISQNEIKLKNHIVSVEKDQNDKNTDVGLANEFIKITNSTEPTEFDVGDAKNLVTLQNGTVMPKSTYDKYVVAVNSSQQKYDEIFKLQDKLALDVKDIKDEDVKYDLVKRNYSDAEKFFSTIGVGFQDIAMKAAYGSSKLQSGLFGIDNKHVDEEFIKVQEASEVYRNKFQKDIKFENAFNKKNIGRFLLQEVQNQAPIFATIATGPVGISILGLSSSGENWSRIVEEDKLYGDETSLLNKMFTSAGYGAAEVVFDRYLTLPVMQRSGKALFGSMKKLREVTKPGMMKYAKEFGKRQLIYDPALEISSEGLTTLTQNMITGRPLTENLAHSLFSGGLFGTAFGHTPFYKGLVMQKFSDYNSYSGYRTNLNKVAGLQVTAKKLNTSLKANKTKGNDTSAIEGNIETVNQEIKSLNQENEGILKTIDKKTNNLSKKWFNIYNDATVEQEQIRIDVENISKDESLNNIEKKNLIEIKQDRFDALQETRDVLRDDKNFGNAYAAFRNSNTKEDQDRLQEISGQATSELINEGKIKPSDDAIDTRAKIIYNTQEINKDYNNKKSMLDGAGFQNFQTVEKAVNFVNKMDLSDVDKQNIIEGIEDGAHGVNIVNNTGAITPMQVVENMAKDDRLETRTHEIGHLVFAAAFGNNKQAFDGIAESVLDFVEQRNSNLYLKLLNQVERDANGDLISEEVLTNFLELVAEGKIDLKSSKNKGLGGFMANILNIGAKKSLGENADFNFEGETDAINFLINLGKKIKAGTLTIKDIEAIERSGIGQKVDTKPETRFSKEASDKVQSIYKKQGEAGAFEIIEQFKPIVSRIAEKRREAPNFDKELLMSEIEIGKRGLFDLIKEYNPESGVPLAAFINTYLPSRAIEASRRVLGEEFTEDVSERVDIAAEEVADVDVKAKPKKKKIVLADRLGVTDKVSKAINKIVPDLDIDKLTFKTLKNKIPEITGELFGIAPKKIENLANLTKKELQSAQMFINKNADLLIAMLPEGATASGTTTGVPNTLLKAFYTKADRAKMAKTGSKAGLAIQQKNNINKTDFLETFGVIDGKPDRTDRNTSARVLALANLTGKMITNQAVRQKLGEADAKSKEAISRLKDGKSSVMFSKDAKALASPLDNFQLTYEQNLGVLSESLFGKNVRIPNHKEGPLKGTRNLEAIFDQETGETYRDAAIRVVNTFLESHPQYRGLIRNTMTGGKRAGLFKFANSKDKKFIEYKKKTSDDINFDDNIVDYPDVEQLGKKQSYNKSEKYSSNFHEKINTKEFKKENAAKLPILLGFFEGVQAHLQNFPNDIWLFEEMLLDTSKHMNTVTRILAPISFYPIDPKTKKPIFNKKAVEEHTDPQNLVGKALLSSAFFGKLGDVWNVIGKSYMQGSILKVDDPSGSLKANMPQSYYDRVVPRLLNGDLKLPNGYSSIIRLAEAGVNPNAYMLINENKTIAEFFEVDGIINPETGLPDIKKQNDIIIKQLTGEVAFRYGENISKVKFSKNIDGHNKLNKAIVKSKTMASKPSKGITVLDFDDTLATSKSLVISTSPDGVVRKLTAEEFAQEGADLLDQGWTHDFSEFSKVVDGKVASLFKKAMKLQGKFGPENMFVLTARPADSAPAIFEFLKANGLNIPLNNITGLANSTSEAKALWIADKVADGYNDFYFADDALQNVQAVDNMLEQFDVKRKVQQAKVKFSKGMNDQFNDILENVTGIESGKRFSIIKGRKRGESKGKFRVFIPPSHEDFVGLLYNFLGKGKEGNAHRDFFEQSLIRPLNRANREYDTARQSIANDYKALNKQFEDVRKKLTKKTPDGDFTFQDAIRVYLWNKHGHKIPGLSETDQAKLVELVQSDSQLQSYAETLNVISKQETYVNPTDGWNGGDIRMDLDDATGRVGRGQFFAEFIENAGIIFSQENLNKIEAGYGKGVRESLEDMLYRIETGRNRPSGQNEQVNKLMNYLNGSVGTVMFFNMRSALLQQMSIVNYINFADNNIFAAAKAFANQKQYWKDFAFIFNSDMLKQRRGGIQTDINGAELAASLRNSKDITRKLISKLLELGFLPTQIGDNIAIATGGATYYRNRINKYIKQGMSQKEAEAAAFTDFQDITQSTQQSARPDMVSKQQASVIGKVILNFQNVTSQFNRLGKKAFQDIYNRRITKPNTTQMQSDISNAARITYYFAIQNAIFYTLQTALFAMMFDDDEEDVNNLFIKKQERLINGSIDSVLRGSGLIGGVVATLKNVAIAFARQRDVNYNPDESAVGLEALNLSPVLGIKLRKIVNAEKTLNYNKKVIKEMETFDIDNPQWSAVTNYTEAFTNIPLNRLYNKTQNVRQALNNDHATWERTLMFLGWSQYNLDLENKKMEGIKEDIKVKSKIESKKKAKIKREEKKKTDLKEKEAEGIEKQKKEKKEGKQVTCLVCKLPVQKGKKYCTIHEKAEQRTDGKKRQCRKRKKDGKRCNMQTSSKSGYCYYHD